MQYSHSKEKAVQYSSAALASIQERSLPPSPYIYELWYVYYSGSNADVTRAIDVLIATKEDITVERCIEIYNQFITDTGQEEEVRKVGNRINETIRNVTGAVTNVKDAAEEYSSKMTNATSQLSDDMSKEQIELVLQDVVSNTRTMITQNKVLEAKLSESTQVMQELERDLEEARKEALTDGLTNLCNRKSFDTEILRVSEEAKEEGHTFSLLMLDIDHFKNFNDDYGHQVGDQVLRLVSKTLVEGVKGRDIVTRYGGEEFAIILPDTNLIAAEKVCDNLRKAVASKDVVNRSTGDVLARITLSGGVAQYYPDETIDALIERADGALYTAKSNGRNQVVAAIAPGQKRAK